MEEFPLLLSLGLLLVLSMACGKLANLIHAPRMVGYLIAGVIFGPSFAGVFSYERVHGEYSMLVDMSLAIIAFSIGGHLKLDTMQDALGRISSISLLQALTSTVFVLVIMYFTLPYLVAEDVYSGLPETALLAVAIILGAASAATAPATIMSLLKEYDAKGNFKNVLLGVMALGDVLTIIFYGFAITIAVTLMGEGGDISLGEAMMKPVVKLGSAFAIGAVGGYILRQMLHYFEDETQVLPLILGAILISAGLSRWLEFSPLLTTMVLGLVVVNTIPQRKYSKEAGSYDAFLVIDRISEAIYGIFFLLAGAHIDFTLALQAGGIALVLTLARFAGKISGAFAGGVVSGSDVNVRRYLGLTLLPAAGVMVGLTLDASQTLDGENVRRLTDIMVSAVLGATLICEIITPFIIRYALRKAGAI